jgi:hypothetical protein
MVALVELARFAVSVAVLDSIEILEQLLIKRVLQKPLQISSVKIIS